MLPPKQPNRSTRQTSTPARAAARAAASPPGPDPATKTSVVWMTGVCWAGSVIIVISSSMEWQFAQGAVDDSCRAPFDDTVAQLMPFRRLGRDIAQGLDSVLSYCFSSKAVQRLGFQIVLQPHQPAFPAVAGLFVAAEGRAVVEATAVDMDCPGAQPSSDAQRSAGISGLQIGSKSVGRIVRDLDGFSFVFERNDHQHGAENLFLGDTHIV